jgi:multidrug efflux pump subunit AcrA (membrane-fusion protein)
MDTIGTVSQGVVTYNVKIAFDVQDDRVKPGMSVVAAIITNTFSDVLFVPSSAIKKQGASSYVEILDGFTTANSDTLSAQGVSSSNLPTRKTVTVGASNDVSTQILEGLSEGEIIVERTIAATTPASTQSGSTGLRIPGFGGVGGTVRTTGGGTGR